MELVQKEKENNLAINEVVIEPLTGIGGVTVRLFALNDRERLLEREALISLGHIQPQAQPSKEINCIGVWPKKAPAVPELGVLPGSLARLAQRSLHCVTLTSPPGVHGSGGGRVGVPVLVEMAANVLAARVICACGRVAAVFMGYLFPQRSISY